MGRARAWLLCAGLLLFFMASRRAAGESDADADVILVLAGGVNGRGRPHETVQRRLQAAARIHEEAQQRGRAIAIVCNGGGTTHKPKYVDDAGYSVPEAALMARSLQDLGVPFQHVYLEGYSDDTLGNAFFARVIHVDPRAAWVNVLVITSEFQMARTQAIYRWIFGLTPLPAGKPAYRLRFHSVDDAGALPRKALASRVAKEEASLASFSDGPLPRMHSLEQVHEWINTKHSAYAAAGVLNKKAMNASAALSSTY